MDRAVSTRGDSETRRGATVFHGAEGFERGWFVASGARKGARDRRLDLRIQGELKVLIVRAAALSGETLSTFVLGSALRRARKVLREAGFRSDTVGEFPSVGQPDTL
jgi:hypothetical protein